jgi:outer membrane protein TolC
MPQETFSVALAPLSDYQTRALEQRTELERLSLTQELGERSAKLAIYDYIPKVALVARYEFAHGTAMQPTNQAFIGLAANWTIFDGLEKHYAAKRAELEASQNATKAEEAEELIALEVSQKYLNLETALEKTALTKQALALADENLRMITAQFAQGESVNTDVLTAQTKRAAARASDVKARIDVLSALAALYLSLGEEPRLTQDAIR